MSEYVTSAALFAAPKERGRLTRRVEMRMSVVMLGKVVRAAKRDGLTTGEWCRRVLRWAAS